MKRATHSMLLGVLLVAVFPVRGQTPTTAVDYFNRAMQRQNARDLDGAIADYNKAIEIDPRYALAYYNRGLERWKIGDRDGAIADYNKAIELDSYSANSYLGRGLALLTKGHDQEAEQDFKKAIELDATLKPTIEKKANEIKEARKATPKS